MMIKKKLLALTFILCSVNNVNANNDLNIKAGFAVDMGFGATILINDKYNVMIGNDGVVADYIFKQGSFDENIPFTWYVGGGVYAEWDDGFGIRLPLGLNYNFAKQWNAYAQVAPDLDFDDDIEFGVQGAIGLRYTF